MYSFVILWLWTVLYFESFATMEFNGNVNDQFPPIFIQFRDFYDEQRRDLLEGFSKQREEMFDNFTTIVDEKNKLIEMNIIKIRNLTHDEN